MTLVTAKDSDRALFIIMNAVSVSGGAGTMNAVPVLDSLCRGAERVSQAAEDDDWDGVNCDSKNGKKDSYHKKESQLTLKMEMKDSY